MRLPEQWSKSRDHFVVFNKMVQIGSGQQRKLKIYVFPGMLGYLIVQNADPDKDVVALGQTYFAIQTRLQEIQQLEEYNACNRRSKKNFLRKELGEHIST